MTHRNNQDEIVEVKEKVTQESITDFDGVPVGSIDRRERVEVVQNERGEHQRRVIEDVGAERQNIVAKIVRFIWLATGLLEFMILLRMLLKLIAANPNNVFTQLVYGFTDLFLWPFTDIVGSPTAGNGMVLEISSFFALLIYAVLAWVFVQMLQLIVTRVQSRSVSVYELDRG